MNINKSLDELVKRDKKLGRMQRGGPNQGGGKTNISGKKPNRIQ